jgi:hypothetical protein
MEELSYNPMGYPYAYYYMPNAFPVSKVVGWCP